MEINTDKMTLRQQMTQLFEQHQPLITRYDTPGISQRRHEAFAVFDEIGFPNAKLENWRNTDISKVLEQNYKYYLEPVYDEKVDLDRIFECNIPHQIGRASCRERV